MKPVHAIAALMLAVPGAASASAPQKTIPAVFQGLWEPDIDDCANVESGTRVVVHANSISYFEEGDTVVSVTPRGPDSIDLVVDYENERLNRTLTLSDNGETLTFSYDDGAKYVHTRCPQGDPHVE